MIQASAVVRRLVVDVVYTAAAAVFVYLLFLDHPLYITRLSMASLALFYLALRVPIPRAGRAVLWCGVSFLQTWIVSIQCQFIVKCYAESRDSLDVVFDVMRPFMFMLLGFIPASMMYAALLLIVMLMSCAASGVRLVSWLGLSDMLERRG